MRVTQKYELHVSFKLEIGNRQISKNGNRQRNNMIKSKQISFEVTRA